MVLVIIFPFKMYQREKIVVLWFRILGYYDFISTLMSITLQQIQASQMSH